MEDGVNRYRPQPLKRRDPHHDAVMARDLETINTGIRREFGSLPPGGLPVVAKRKPVLPTPDTPVLAAAESE